MVFPVVGCFWVYLVLHVHLTGLVVAGETHTFLVFGVVEFCRCDVLLSYSDDENQKSLEVLISDVVNQDVRLGKVNLRHSLWSKIRVVES